MQCGTLGLVNPTATHLQQDSGDPSGIRIELFGHFRVTANRVPLTAHVTHRMQALLAYVLLHAGSSVRRQQLAFLFWPDTTEPQARTNLRQLRRVAVKRCCHRSTGGCEGPQPSRSPSISVATAGSHCWPIPWRATLRRSRETVLASVISSVASGPII
jgi:hypothetical protein